MKPFFYRGHNPKNKSGVSWKIWRIETRGRKVVLSWGPAIVVKRRIVPAGILHSKSRTLSSHPAAVEDERERIQSKLRKGYTRKPRRKNHENSTHAV